MHALCVFYMQVQGSSGRCKLSSVTLVDNSGVTVRADDVIATCDIIRSQDCRVVLTVRCYCVVVCSFFVRALVARSI